MTTPTPLEELLGMLPTLGFGNKEDQSVLSRALDLWKLKREEKEKIGDMLVEFFEAEMAIDDLIVSALRIRKGALEDAKETLLPFIPARKKSDFLKRNALFNKKIADLFHRLHDQRNQIAHPQGASKRPGKTVTQDIRKQFIKDCKKVLKVAHEAHSKIFQDEVERYQTLNKKAVVASLRVGDTLKLPDASGDRAP